MRKTTTGKTMNIRGFASYAAYISNFNNAIKAVVNPHPGQ